MSTIHDLYWANYFGTSAVDFGTRGVSVVPHVGLAGYNGVWFFLRGERMIVSAPDAWLTRLRDDLVGATPELPSPSVLVGLFGSNLERHVGPAFQGALEASAFRPVESAGVRAIAETDREAVIAFRAACGSDDWEASGQDGSLLHRAAHFENGAVTAMAGLRAKGGNAGDPCVLTHPNYRGSGLGKRVISAVIGAALAENRVLLYQTLESNLPAVRLALGLGYTRYANHVAARLNPASPPS